MTGSHPTDQVDGCAETTKHSRPEPEWPPAYIRTLDLVPHFGAGFDARRVRKWLDRIGITKRIGGVVVVTPHDLREALPTIWERYARAHAMRQVDG